MKNKKTNCRGSFIVGTACGICDRCNENNYTPEKRSAAIEKEKIRTKDFPADRVKKKRAVYIVDK